MPMSGLCIPAYLCIRLDVADAVGARQFRLMSFVSGTRIADYAFVKDRRMFV
jgi:hypothetical protein